MEERLINRKLSEIIKEIGFNIPVCNFYSDSSPIKQREYRLIDPIDNNKMKDSYSAPTLSLLQKWIREEYGIFLTVECNGYGRYRWHGFNVDSTNSKYPKFKGIDSTNLFEIGHDDYIYECFEDALEYGLMESVKMIKEYKYE